MGVAVGRGVLSFVEAVRLPLVESAGIHMNMRDYADVVPERGVQRRQPILPDICV